jgi:hypothetical protein
MSRNGSGVYSLPTGNPVVTATTISSTWANNTLTDIANALTGSVSADGQTPLTGNLNVNNNNLTNVNQINTVNIVSTGTVTGGTGVVNYGSGQFYKDASGNIGIGVTPSAWNSSAKTLQIGTKTSIYDYSTQSVFGCNSYIDGSGSNKYLTSNGASLYALDNSGIHTWYTAPSGTAGASVSFVQKMQIDASGNLLIGQNSLIQTEKLGVTYSSVTSAGINTNNTNTGISTAMGFFTQGLPYGSITTSTSGTSYNTTSDYRLKSNPNTLLNAIETINKLKPVSFTWDTDKSDDVGFLAHELQEVIPRCVFGDKDAFDAKGNPVYQQIDNSGIIPYLVKAIQELNARIVVLENKK